MYATTTSSSVSTPSSTLENASSSMNPDQEAEQSREKIESDLKNWQDKFAKAADKGTEDLQERVNEITERQIHDHISGVGEALIVQLEESSSTELLKLKKAIRSIVASIPKDANEMDLEKAEGELSKATRSAGLSIKARAQALRSWKQDCEQETKSLVTAASESTLEVIDNIRDLGLQEIGMRWAWMEDVTYKDWSKYHLLKKTFDKWRQEVESVAQNHSGLQRVSEAMNEIENRGMNIAEETAKELGRVKEVGKWKIHALDTSDDFSTKYMPAAAVVAGQNLRDKASSASEQLIGTTQGSMESIISHATKKGSKAVSSASSKMLGTEPSMAIQASSTISEASKAASNAVNEAVSGTHQPKAESVKYAGKAKINQAAAGASEAIVGSLAPGYESLSLKASEHVNSIASAISEALPSSSTLITESASSSASSVSSGAPRKVFGGAMAQKVKEQKPIFDDIVEDDEHPTYSEKLQEIIENAGDKYGDVTRAVSEALLKATSTQGSVESVTSVADAQYSSALAVASRILYGTQQDTAESITSVVSGKYAEAVAALVSMNPLLELR